MFNNDLLEKKESLKSKSATVIDFSEASNKLKVAKEKVPINEELQYAVMQGMPQSLALIQKAIYIYIKLCRILTYDQEFFVFGQKGFGAIKHHFTDFVANITPTNNDAVCFEFNTIYRFFINSLGLKNETIRPYNDRHEYLQFICDDFFIKADAVTSILNGDLVHAKLDHALDEIVRGNKKIPLNGLVCLNESVKKQCMFEAMIPDIFELIIKQEQREKKAFEKQTIFNNALMEYNASHPVKKSKIILGKKIDLLMNQILNSGLDKLDAIGYLRILKTNCFSENERENNFAAIIIKENVEDEKYMAISTVVLAMNDCSFESSPERTIYFIYNPPSRIVKIEKEEIETRFKTKQYEITEGSKSDIPGIRKEETRIKC